jgi:hypothetical protein
MSGGYPAPPRSYLQELAARGELKPYNEEETQRWLKERARLRQLRDDPATSMKDRFKAIQTLG